MLPLSVFFKNRFFKTKNYKNKIIYIIILIFLLFTLTSDFHNLAEAWSTALITLEDGKEVLHFDELLREVYPNGLNNSLNLDVNNTEIGVVINDIHVQTLEQNNRLNTQNTELRNSNIELRASDLFIEQKTLREETSLFGTDNSDSIQSIINTNNHQILINQAIIANNTTIVNTLPIITQLTSLILPLNNGEMPFILVIFLVSYLYWNFKQMRSEENLQNKRHLLYKIWKKIFTNIVTECKKRLTEWQTGILLGTLLSLFAPCIKKLYKQSKAYVTFKYREFTLKTFKLLDSDKDFWDDLLKNSEEIYDLAKKQIEKTEVISKKTHKKLTSNFKNGITNFLSFIKKNSEENVTYTQRLIETKNDLKLRVLREKNKEKRYIPRSGSNSPRSSNFSRQSPNGINGIQRVNRFLLWLLKKKITNEIFITFFLLLLLC